MHGNPSKASEASYLYRFTRYALAIALAWSVLLGILLAIGVRQARRQIFEQAKSEASGAYNKDLSYLEWAATHGGVYAPVTEITAPSPYLKDIPERDISTPSGRRLTLLSPTYMTRQVFDMAAETHGPRGHITSLKPIRPENRPDAWETAALQSFERDETERIETVDIDGRPFLRMMHPMLTEKGCLKCHATQGYKEGDIRGGISISIPLAPYLAMTRDNTIYIISSYGSVWALGLLALAGGAQRLRRRMSERDQAQRSLVESELIFREFMEHSPVYVFFKDENIRALRLSRNYEAMTGKPLEELLGKSMYELFPSEPARNMVADDLRILKERKEVVTEEELNGRCYRTIKFPITVEGKPPCLAGYAIDITEQKQAAEKTARINERLVLAGRAAHLGIWDWDLANNRLVWDDRMFELYGVGKEAFSGVYEDWLKWVHPGDRARCEAEIELSLREEKEYNTEFRIVRPDGAVRHIKVNADIFRGPDGEQKRMIGVNSDITESRLAEEARLSHLLFFENMDRINRAIQGAEDLEKMMSGVLRTVLEIFDCDRAWLFYPCDPDAPSFRVPMEITKPGYPGAKLLNTDIPLPPDMARDLREALDSPEPVAYTLGTEKTINEVSAGQFGVKAMMMIALYPKSGKPWAFGLHQCSYPRVWTPEERRLLQEISRRLADSITSLLSHR